MTQRAAPPTDPINQDAPVPDIVPAEFVICPGANPHPANSALRAAAPVHKIDFPVGAQAYVVLGHQAVATAFTDPRLSKRLDNGPDWFRDETVEGSPVLANNMLLADPPDHSRLRIPVSRAFSPRRMERLRPMVERITNDLIDALPSGGTVDLMDAFALALPLLVICEFLGVPQQDRPLFQSWGMVLSQCPSDEGAQDQRRSVSDEVHEYLTKLLAVRRADLRADLVSDLIRAADEEGMFSDEELISTLIFLLIAGHKTTANLIGNGMHALLRHPDELSRLRENPHLVLSAVEEFLRYEGPVDRGTFRVATEQMRLAGTDIPEQSFVHLCVAAADRDPAVFADPDRLDIGRSPNRHLAFGYGAHFCAGAALARLEGHVAFPALLRRLPGIELAVPPEQLTWVADSSISRGLEQLPVRYDHVGPR